MDLNKKILRGVYWTGIQTIIEQSLSFIVKLILARLLFPEDFGLVGMAVVFTSFVGVFNDIGIGAALVQKKASTLREEHFHTAFWTGVGWSIFLYSVISLAIAPLAAQFYKEPILESLIPILSIGVLAGPVNLVHKAQLSKELNFKRIALIGNICNIFSGILAISLAFLGFGVWSLVFNSVASVIIAIPLFFKATGWYPKFIWEKKAFKEIFGFGMYTTGSAVFNNLTSQIDYLVVGKMLSASALGIYTLAFILTETVKNHAMSMMNKVMYPVYGQIQDNKISVRNYYLKVVAYNSVLIYPIMVIMLVLGKPLIIQFFGEKWEGAIIPLQILALSVMFSLMVNSHTSVIRGMGKPKLEMKIQLFRSIFVFIPAVIIGTYYYGMVGTAIAVLINKIAAVFFAQYILKNLIDLEFSKLFLALRPPLLATFLSGVLGFLSYNYLEIPYLVVFVEILLIYIIIIYFLMKEDILVIKGKIMGLKKNNSI